MCSALMLSYYMTVWRPLIAQTEGLTNFSFSLAFLNSPGIILIYEDFKLTIINK